MPASMASSPRRAADIGDSEKGERHFLKTPGGEVVQWHAKLG